MSNRSTSFSEHDQDAFLSSTKIDPLKSPTKYHVPHDPFDNGVVGEDRDIEKVHEEPLNSSVKHHHQQLPHVDTHGVVGSEDTIESTKIEPLDGNYKHTHPSHHTQGLDLESIDASRIPPMGEVRED